MQNSSEVFKSNFDYSLVRLIKNSRLDHLHKSSHFRPFTIKWKYVSRDFFFRVCYALVTRIKTLSRLKHTVLNDVLNRRFKRFNHFMRKNKGRLWN